MSSSEGSLSDKSVQTLFRTRELSALTALVSADDKRLPLQFPLDRALLLQNKVATRAYDPEELSGRQGVHLRVTGARHSDEFLTRPGLVLICYKNKNTMSLPGRRPRDVEPIIVRGCQYPTGSETTSRVSPRAETFCTLDCSLPSQRRDPGAPRWPTG